MDIEYGIDSEKNILKWVSESELLVNHKQNSISEVYRWIHP